VKDIRQHVGEVHQVTEETTGRTVTVSVGDAGPLPWWDHRPMLTLTVTFTDGRRSHVSTADSAAGQLAHKLFHPYSVGVLNSGDGFEMQIGRQRERGAKNGGTRYVFTVFAGPVDDYPDLDEMFDRGATREEVLAAVAAHGRERAGIAEVEARYAEATAEAKRAAMPAAHRDAHAELMRELASR
jgi:hypothetical protein